MAIIWDAAIKQEITIYMHFYIPIFPVLSIRLSRRLLSLFTWMLIFGSCWHQWWPSTWPFFSVGAVHNVPTSHFPSHQIQRRSTLTAHRGCHYCRGLLSYRLCCHGNCNNTYYCYFSFYSYISINRRTLTLRFIPIMKY